MSDLLLRRRNLLIKEQENIRAVCFMADGEQTVAITKVGAAPNITMQYSYNGKTWDTWDLSPLSFGDSTKVYVRGVGNTSFGSYSSKYNTFVFGTDAYVYVSGIIESLLDGENEVLVLNSSYMFMNLFSKQTALRSVENLKFEAQTIESNKSFIYGSMFSGCINLLYAPKILPAQNLLGGYCYGSMFEDCTSLITAPKLPATTVSRSAYQYMFQRCTSLVNAPELPATTLDTTCYQYMFQGCTSLINAPKLPATTLANQCYQYMFRGCTSLINVPELPATTLRGGCYLYMFEGCKKLNTIRCRAKVTATNATRLWLSGVKTLGTLYGYSEYGWSSDASGIPSGWEFVELTD